VKQVIRTAYSIILLLVLLIVACLSSNEIETPSIPESDSSMNPIAVSSEEEIGEEASEEIPSNTENASPVLDEPVLKLSGLYWMVGPKSGLEGSEERFQKLLGVLEDNLIHNKYISGVYVIYHWDLLEPEEGVIFFKRLDKVTEVIRGQGKHYKLSINPGIYCPDWLYEKGCEAFPTTGSNPARTDIYNQPVRIPLPWDSVFQDYYFRVLEKVADRYGDDESLYAVTLTLANFMSPEWHLPHQKEDRELWEQYEEYQKKIERAWQAGIDRFAVLFPNQQLVLEASSWPIGIEELGRAVIDYGATQHQGRFTIQINQMVGRYDMINNESYFKLIESKEKYGDDITIGIQNLKGWEYPSIREVQGSLEMAVYNFIQSGAEYWELWYGDGANIETCETLFQLIADAHSLGNNGYGSKLKDNGLYIPPK